MTKGGKRKGAGAKPRSDTKSTNRSIKFTDAEWETVGKASSFCNCSNSALIRELVLMYSNEIIDQGYGADLKTTLLLITGNSI